MSVLFSSFILLSVFLLLLGPRVVDRSSVPGVSAIVVVSTVGGVPAVAGVLLFFKMHAAVGVSAFVRDSCCC
jgi:hypothetical protein